MKSIRLSAYRVGCGASLDDGRRREGVLAILFARRPQLQPGTVTVFRTPACHLYARRALPRP